MSAFPVSTAPSHAYRVLRRDFRHGQLAQASLKSTADSAWRPAGAPVQTCRNNRRRAQRAAAIVAGAMITPPQWKGEPAVAADSSSSLCDMWAEKEVQSGGIKFTGIHHVAIICADLERSLEFYCGLLGLAINKERPHKNLPYRGAWLWTGPEMIHLMELPNPDPMENRADHGGRDRHACFGVESVAPIADALKARGIPFTMSKSGRAAIFYRDPDMNTLECVELPMWR